VGSMAQMTCAGNLARDVEMREAAGHPVVDLIVMVNQKLYKGKNPDGSSKYEEDVLSVSATFWRDRAGSIASLNLKKGTFVIVTGNPRLRTYMRNNGEPGAEIILENPDLTLGPRMDGGGGNGAYSGERSSGGYSRPQSVTPPVRGGQPPRPQGARPPQARQTTLEDNPIDVEGDVPFEPAPSPKGEDDW
jgi:single-stranded DNA-binding protein